MRRSGEDARSTPPIGFEVSKSRRREVSTQARARSQGLKDGNHAPAMALATTSAPALRPNPLAKDGAFHRVDVGDRGQPIHYVGIRVMRE